MAGVLGFLGGTGPLGKGLALRFALAGHSVLLGSRDAQRAAEAAGDLMELARGGDVQGAINDEVAARCDTCFVAVPYEGLRRTLDGVAEHLDGKLVVSCVNALAFDGGPHFVAPEAGSSAEECRALLPGARLTAAFHTISAPKLLDPGATLEGDVPVCGDDPADRERTLELAWAIPGLRGLHAGPLRHSATLEALTAMIITINQHYRTSAGIAFTNVDPARTA